ncbi:response regulator transcription factor [Phycicoccus jejuensis]|uniref:response regulator transcription factor n=1 Tax=Phycicoccus jejuensis TaxID=367299 RepID=UPI003850D443
MPSRTQSSVAALVPDVVIVELDVENGGGLEPMSELLDVLPGLHVVLLVAVVTDSLLERAMMAGASALLPEDGSLEDLLRVLRDIRKGGLWVHPSLLRLLVNCSPSEAPADAPVHLIAREDQVLQLLGEGCAASMIAPHLGMSRTTCRGYVAALMSKLGAHSQLEVVAMARRRGLLRGGKWPLHDHECVWAARRRLPSKDLPRGRRIDLAPRGRVR